MASDDRRPKKPKKRPKFSEMVFQREEDAAALISAFEVYEKSIVEGLERRHRPLLREGEILPDYGLSLDLTAREVRGAIGLLVDLDQEHSAHKAELEGLRHARNELVKRELHPCAVTVRGSIDSLLGREAGSEFHGMRGKTPRKLPRLAVAVKGLAQSLEHVQADPPEAGRPGLGSVRELWLDLLRAARKQLAGNTQRLRRAKARDEHLRLDKTTAMKEFDVVYSQALRKLEAMMIEARVDAGLIKSLRSRSQRRRMRKRARQKRAARAAAKAAAPAATESSSEAAEEAAREADEAVDPPVLPVAEPGEEAAERGGEAVRSTVARWLGKGRGSA